MRLNKLMAVLIVLVLTCTALFADEARLLRNPDICGDKVVFVYAEDLWIGSVNGGEARRLTTFSGVESNPRFSPDGKFIAFTGEYDGNMDVYVMPVTGGEPKRLTWHPAPDLVRGWTKDSKKIVFASNRDAAPSASIYKFWTIGINDKMPESLPVPRIFKGKLLRCRNFRGMAAMIIPLSGLVIRSIF